MKRLFLFFGLSMLLATISLSQGSLDLKITLKDKYGKPMPNTDVTFTETATKVKVVKKSDQIGRLTVLLDQGRHWRISVLKIRDWPHWYVSVPKRGNGKGEMILTYNYERYERETRPLVDRSKLNLVVEKQRYSSNEKATKELGIVKLKISRSDKRTPLSKFPVQLTSYDLNKTFTATTDYNGVATFKVPLGKEYEIDIDGIESFGFVDVSTKPFSTSGKKFIYEPTVVDEKMIGDTVVQNLPLNVKGTTARELAKINVKAPGGVWANEPVYLEEIHGKKIYKGITDENGKVKFLLPKGKKYMIHFKYRRDVDVFNFTRIRGIGYSGKSINYIPNRKLQFPGEYIPTPEELVVDQFQKFIENQLPDPSAGETIGVHAEFGAPINGNSRQAVLQLGFSTNHQTKLEDYKTPPMNLSFVVDVSGSMAGHDRIENLKTSLIEFVQHLRPKDRISLIAFNDETQLLIPSTEIGVNKKALIDEIERLDADGGTIIYNGLEAGYKQVLGEFKKKAANRVILLTDGYGSAPIDSITKMSKSYNEQGVECSAVGVGEDYNFALLRLLASQGGGLISLVYESDKMNDAFSTEMKSLLSPVARNVKVEVIYNKKVVFSQLLGQELKTKGNDKIQMKLKDFYAGLDQHAIVKFKLDKPVKEIENEPVIIRTRYFDLEKQKVISTETSAALKWSDEDGKLELFIDREKRKLYAIAIMNQTLKVMSESFSKDNREKAKLTLEETIKDVKELYPEANDEDVRMLKTRLEEYYEILKNLR